MRLFSRWPVTLLFAFVTIVLSLAGYYVQQAPARWPGALDWLVATISLFKMSWSWKEAGSPPWTLEIARFTGASFTISALAKVWMKFFGEQMTRLRLSWSRGHVVVCGLGRKGLQLATEFRRRDFTVVVLDRSPKDDEARHCRRRGILLQAGDATRDDDLESAGVEHARYLVAVCHDDRTNLEIAMAALARFRTHGGGRLTCYAHLVNLPLRVLLERHQLLSQRPEGFELRFFNIFENTARALLAEHPLERVGDRRVHLVIVGLTRLGEAIATQAARVAHYAQGEPLHLTLVDEEAATRGEQFLLRQPGLREACALSLETVRFASTRFTQMEFLPADPGARVTVVFCLEQDETNVSLALALSEHRRPGLSFIATMAERQGLARLLAASAEQLSHRSVQIFGAIEDVCGWEILRAEQHDTLARAVAENYRLQHGGATWAGLDEEARSSNRAAADHLDIKLRAIGCERFLSAQPVPFAFTAEELDLLGQMEHRRWWADHLLRGWTLGPERDRARKLHPDLVPWEQLDEPTREKDREQVRDLPAVLAQNGEGLRRRPPAVIVP